MYDPTLHLFVDDHGIAEMQNVERVVVRPTRHSGPVVFADRPWESPWLFAWGSVIRDPNDGLIRLWYDVAGWRSSPLLIRTLYAESVDGIRWSKPGLGRYAFAGSSATNIVLATHSSHWDEDEGERLWRDAEVSFLHGGYALHETVSHYDGVNVVVDEAETDPARRYKCIMSMWSRGQRKHAHYLMESPDGIVWPRAPEKVLEKINDGTKVIWDPIRRRWLLTWLSSRRLESGEAIRYLELSESEDLRAWRHIGKPFELDDEDGHGLVMQGHFLMPFAWGDQYLGFANMIHTMEGWCQGYLVSSRDGQHWERPLRRDPIVALGGEDEFDADSAEAAIGAPILMGDDMLIFYCGRARRHWAPSAATGAIGLLRLKRDRFAGLANGGWFNRGCYNLASGGGVVVTEPVEVTGPRLLVNVKSRQVAPETGQEETGSAAWGTVRVELLDEEKRPINGFLLEQSIPYRGDEVRAEMHWAGGAALERLIGRRVRLRLSINMATVYAYTFA